MFNNELVFFYFLVQFAQKLCVENPVIDKMYNLYNANNRDAVRGTCTCTRVVLEYSFELLNYTRTCT